MLTVDTETLLDLIYLGIKIRFIHYRIQALLIIHLILGNNILDFPLKLFQTLHGQLGGGGVFLVVSK